MPVHDKNSRLWRHRVRIAILIVFWGVLVPDLHAWYDKVHTLVILEAVRLLQRTDQTRIVPFYKEIAEPRFLKKLGMGAWAEDHQPAVRGNERSFRHYYDPDAAEGQRGCPFYYHYYVWGPIENAKVAKPVSGWYDGARDWALNDIKTGNILNWAGAISAYDYTDESKEVAYFRLGHVGHLLADMSESDHALNIPHPGSGKIIPDTLEEVFGEPILRRIDANLSYIPYLPDALKYLLALDYAILKSLFIGKGPEDKWIGYEGLIENSVDFGAVQEYFMEDDLTAGGMGYVRKPRIGNPPEPMIAGNEVERFATPEEFFDELARLTKRATALAGLTAALGCADLEGFMDNRFFPTLRLLHEPIYIIPTIRMTNEEDTGRHYALAWDLLKKAVEYDAGLFELFLDVVNPPPYVRSLSLVQGSKGRYERELSDVTVDREIEPANRFYPSERESYPVVSKREWVLPDEADFVTGERVDVTIAFGPVSGARSKPIDPNSVVVKIGGQLVSGRLADGGTWEGSFVPELPEGVSQRDFNIEIAAKDIYDHYPRPGLPESGYELDAEPESPAKSTFRPPYNWDHYNPGADRNHTIRVKREEEKREEEEPAEEREPREPTAPADPPARTAFLIWIDKCGEGPGGRIHAGSQGEFESKLRCCDEWLFGKSQNYVSKQRISGPFATLADAIKEGCGMISEAGYRNVLGWGAVPYASMGGVTYLLDEDLAGACIKKDSP